MLNCPPGKIYCLLSHENCKPYLNKDHYPIIIEHYIAYVVVPTSDVHNSVILIQLSKGNRDIFTQRDHLYYQVLTDSHESLRSVYIVYREQTQTQTTKTQTYTYTYKPDTHVRKHKRYILVVQKNRISLTNNIEINTGLFKMIVGVLTTCHTQYT